MAGLRDCVQFNKYAQAQHTYLNLCVGDIRSIDFSQTPLTRRPEGKRLLSILKHLKCVRRYHRSPCKSRDVLYRNTRCSLPKGYVILLSTVGSFPMFREASRLYPTLFSLERYRLSAITMYGIFIVFNIRDFKFLYLLSVLV